jgi:hypothetical protein
MLDAKVELAEVDQVLQCQEERAIHFIALNDGTTITLGIRSGNLQPFLQTSPLELMALNTYRTAISQQSH